MDQFANIDHCQGLSRVGSAMIQGNGMATLISTFPNNERGKVLGTHLSVVGSGAIAGPALGGLLISVWGWQSVFSSTFRWESFHRRGRFGAARGVDSPRSGGSKFDWSARCSQGLPCWRSLWWWAMESKLVGHHLWL